MGLYEKKNDNENAKQIIQGSCNDKVKIFVMIIREEQQRKQMKTNKIFQILKIR